MNKILYHANCTDGQGAALAVWSKLGDKDTDYIPCQYGEPLPDDLDGHHIVMVDFSTKREQTLELLRVCPSVTIIDHHKTAQAELEGLDHPRLSVTFDMTKSGAVLAWEAFNDDDVPELLLHVQDRDLWKFEMDDTKEIVAMLRLYDWRTWPYLTLEDLVTGGEAITRFMDVESDKIINTKPRLFNLTGDTVPLYNLQGFMISDTLNKALAKYPEAPYAVAYFDLPDKRVYSLRSREGGRDVSAIAASFGGGGHACAAGFTREESE